MSIQHLPIVLGGSHRDYNKISRLISKEGWFLLGFVPRYMKLNDKIHNENRAEPPALPCCVVRPSSCSSTSTFGPPHCCPALLVDVQPSLSSFGLLVFVRPSSSTFGLLVVVRPPCHRSAL